MLAINVSIPNLKIARLVRDIAAILDFQKLKFLTFGTVKRVELHNHAKLCRNRSNRGRDIAIFRIFKMADDAMLDF